MKATLLKEATSAISGRKLIRLPAVIERTGMSRSTIYARMNAADFPRAIPLGRRVNHYLEGKTRSTMVAWLADEVDAYIAARTAERDEAFAR